MRLPPKIESVISNDSDGQYKMSFTNTSRPIQEQIRVMGGNNPSQRDKVSNSGGISGAHVSSHYERPSFLSSLEEDNGERR